MSTSADGTFIRTRDGPVEVKLGMWWTGAHRASPSAHHPKFLLHGEGSYASTEGADRFGQTIYALAAARAGITRAHEVSIISHGAGWLADLPADWIAPTAIQLDQFHGELRISEVARDPERAARWWAWVTEHSLGALGRSIASLTRSGAIDPEAGRVLFGYLAEGVDAFHTYIRLQDAGHTPQMAPRGSGAMETTSTSSWPDASSARACGHGAATARTTCSRFGASRWTRSLGASGGVGPPTNPGHHTRSTCGPVLASPVVLRPRA